MTAFRTKLKLNQPDFSISHDDQMLCLGSCFAQHIGQLLHQKKFKALLNPFGILYNPGSISRAIERLEKQQLSEEADLFNHQGQWHSFDHHGNFSSPDKKISLDKINSYIKNGHEALKNSSRIIITLGTANVFWHKKSNRIVANCHKLPNEDFERRALEVEDIIADLAPIFQRLTLNNKRLKIILTVSPVRHIRDGLIENQRSKAKLLLAVERLSDQLQNVFYFPAYELMMDDLRDYRFYAPDMIHPNETAIKYIWDFFQEAFFRNETTDLIQQIDKIISASKHRAFQIHSEGHQQFLKKQLAQIKKLESQYAFLSFEEEKVFFEEQRLV